MYGMERTIESEDHEDTKFYVKKRLLLRHEKYNRLKRRQLIPSQALMQVQLVQMNNL